jgi:hypothetical protein
MNVTIFSLINTNLEFILIIRIEPKTRFSNFKIFSGCRIDLIFEQQN